MKIIEDFITWLEFNDMAICELHCEEDSSGHNNYVYESVSDLTVLKLYELHLAFNKALTAEERWLAVKHVNEFVD
jgi:hypothetical protein